MSASRKIIFAVFGAIAIVLALLSLVPSLQPADPIVAHTVIPTYEDLLRGSENFFVAGEIQAAPLINAGVATNYRPDFIGTVIIAVDRDVIKEEITGWNSLRTGEYSISFFTDTQVFGRTHVPETSNVIDISKLVLSIAAGLDRQSSTYSNAIDFLRYLQRADRLITNGTDAPVRLMMDFQAAQLKIQGANIEIIVPEEGTLSFSFGAASLDNSPLPKVNSSALLQMGFRLPGGDCEVSVYPSSEKYQAAKQVTEIDAYAQKVRTVTSDYNRQVLGDPLFGPANFEERMFAYLLFLILFSAWSGTLLKRIADKHIQNYFLTMCILIFAWILLRIVKMPLQDLVAVRYLWYLFYPFMLFIPVMMFWLGLEVGFWRQTKVYMALKWIPFIISGILLLFVLTNDLHQRVFKFYNGIEVFEEYGYGLFYIFIFVWSVVLTFAFVALSARRYPNRPKRNYLPVVAVLLLGIVYCLGYGLNIPAFHGLELTLSYGIIALAFIECSLRTGLIRGNTKYETLFRYAAMDLHILNDHFESVYTTIASLPLPVEIARKIQLTGSGQNEFAKLNISSDETVTYESLSIRGGYAVITEHMDEVIRLQGVLGKRSAELAERNSILQGARDTLSQRSKVLARQSLVAITEQTLKEKTDEITAIMNTIPSHTDVGSDTETYRKLAKVKLLVNYCKRRGNLMLLEMEDSFSDTATLALWLKETMMEAQSCDIRGIVSESGAVPIPMNYAVFCYNVFQSIIECSLENSDVIILTGLTASKQVVVLRIAITAAQPLHKEHFEPKGRALDTWQQHQGTIHITEEDERLVFLITVPVGGAQDD